MNVKWNKKELLKLLKDFSTACNVNINMYDKDVNILYDNKFLARSYCEEIQKTKEGKENCFLSDKKIIEKCRETKTAQIHLCHAGLLDIAIPIILNEELAGYTILGQIRTEKTLGEVFNSDRKKTRLAELYQHLPFFDYEHIQSLITVATVFSKYIFTEKLYSLEENDVTQEAVSYMKNNLKNSISVKDITKNIGICKSTLYKRFKNEYNCTPKAYLNKMRAEKSLGMLLCTDYSIEKISEQSGFSDISYYSKVFKKIYGMSPLQYRKENKLKVQS